MESLEAQERMRQIIAAIPPPSADDDSPPTESASDDNGVVRPTEEASGTAGNTAIVLAGGSGACHPAAQGLSQEQIAAFIALTFLAAPPSPIPAGLRAPRLHWRLTPSENGAPRSAGIRMGPLPQEFYHWWAGTACCANKALRETWEHLSCGLVPPDTFQGHPDAPRQRPFEVDLTFPPEPDDANPQPPWAQAPENWPDHTLTANQDPANSFWALDPFWRGWALRHPPHPVDGGCTASLPFGALRPRNEGRKYRRRGSNDPRWAYQPPVVSNRRACALGWRSVNTQENPTLIARFLRWSLRPGEEEGTAVEFLDQGERATASGHASFALCPACSLAQNLLMLRGEGALKWTSSQLRSWIGSIDPQFFNRYLLELALNHQQAIDLSEDEGDRNDDWVPDYAFPVAAADKKILPPRNWKDPSEDGDDSDFLML